MSTTKALELGIDVGGLDASILVGYPGTLAGFFQQAGRAGRRTEDALVVLVGLDTPATGAILGELNKFDAPDILHPEAIYLHRGDTYRVLTLNLVKNIARVVRVETDYYTQPLGGTDNYTDRWLDGEDAWIREQHRT